MNNKWTDGELVPAKNWVENYSQASQKILSFGLCAFVLFSLFFVGITGIPLILATFIFFLTGINALLRTDTNKKISSTITIIGYFSSIAQIIYANI